MLCSDVHQFAAGLVQPLVDDRIGAFTVQREFPFWAANYTQKYKDVQVSTKQINKAK